MAVTVLAVFGAVFVVGLALLTLAFAVTWVNGRSGRS